MRFALLFLLAGLISSAAFAQAPMINEIRIDQSGADDDEYFELYAPTAGGTFAPGVAYIVIGDGSGGSGVIEAIVDLGGVEYGPDNYFLAAEATFSLGTADHTTSLNFENGDNVTHMYVSGFTGTDQQDLDTDDDGILDITPWTFVHSCVALLEEVGGGDQTYCTDTVGPDGTFVPAHVYVQGCCSAGTNWLIGTFDHADPMAADTPGFANLVPVELTSFDATVNGNDINLNWETASETNNAGFEVQLRGDGEYQAMGFVDGNGTTTETQNYNHTISGLAAGTYTIRLKQIDFDGAFEYSPEVEVAIGVPGSHILTQAYPNPFNPQASFSLSVATEQHVEINLFNTLGQQVGTIFSGTLEGGQARSFTINGGNLPSGAYFYRAVGANFAETGRVMLLK